MHDPNAPTPPNAEAPATPAAAPAATAADLPPQAAASEPPPAPEPSPAEEIAALQARIAELEQQLATRDDDWLRAKAETENVRRRGQEETLKAGKFGGEKFASAMLPVKDSLEAALATEQQTLEALREGVELTLKQLVAAFDSASVREENPLGAKFDPNVHQAISAVPAEAEDNTVINVLQKGYVLHDRVLRPALVIVAA